MFLGQTIEITAVNLGSLPLSLTCCVLVFAVFATLCVLYETVIKMVMCITPPPPPPAGSPLVTEVWRSQTDNYRSWTPPDPPPPLTTSPFPSTGQFISPIWCPVAVQGSDQYIKARVSAVNVRCWGQGSHGQHQSEWFTVGGSVASWGLAVDIRETGDYR